MKRIVNLLLILTLLLGILVPAVSAEYYGQCGNGLTWWVSEDGVLTIEGVGEMEDYAATSDVPWASYNDVIRDVFIGEKVETIGQNAFAESMIENIYFHGTEDMWDAVVIGSGNEPLSEATIHYMPWFYIYTGDCFHTPEAFCNCCDMAVTGGTMPCVDDDWDYICDQCGGELCIHSNTTVYYTPLGDMRHMAMTVCIQCDQVLDNVTEYCLDINGDYTCELCWYSACAHTRYKFGYYPMGGGIHSASTTCADCGMTIEEQMAICVDADQNYRCDYCGDSTCTHKNLNSTYAPLENNMHSISSVCALCGKNMGTDTGRCVDLDGDGLCQFCKRNLCPHTDLSETYAASKDGSHLTTVTCVCGKQMEQRTDSCADETADGVCDKCGAQMVVLEKINIFAANMTLGNDLKMNFAIRTSDLKEGYVVKVTQEGREPVVLEPVYHDATFSKVIYPIAAKEMADTLICEIYNADGQLISEPFSRTVRDYAMGQLNKQGQKETMKSLVVDMLNYGTEAQKNFHYHEDAYANAQITEEQQAQYATADVAVTNNLVKGSNYAASKLTLGDSILLVLGFRNYEEGMTAKVTFTDFRGREREFDAPVTKDGTYAAVTVNQIVLGDAKCDVNVTVYKADGSVHGTATDSVASYVARTGDSGLNKAIMKLATSAAIHLG